MGDRREERGRSKSREGREREEALLESREGRGRSKSKEGSGRSKRKEVMGREEETLLNTRAYLDRRLLHLGPRDKVGIKTY